MRGDVAFRRSIAQQERQTMRDGVAYGSGCKENEKRRKKGKIEKKTAKIIMLRNEPNCQITTGLSPSDHAVYNLRSSADRSAPHIKGNACWIDCKEKENMLRKKRMFKRMFLFLSAPAQAAMRFVGSKPDAGQVDQ